MDQSQDILLDVEDPEASARFYGRLLQGRPVQVGPDRALVLLASGRRLSLWRRTAQATQADQAVGFAVDRASDVDDLHVDWWDRGARILTPPCDLPQGRGFVASDPDGHRLCVFAAA